MGPWPVREAGRTPAGACVAGNVENSGRSINRWRTFTAEGGHATA